jgi:integration host factor subunit beta
MESTTKSELIDKVSREFGEYKKKDVERAVNVIFDTMKLALINDQRIEIRGLGTFKVKERPARQGRNPKSGEGVAIPDRKIPFFKAGRALKLKLNADDA